VKIFANCGPPRMTGMTEARDFKFGMHIQGGSHNKNYAKRGDSWLHSVTDFNSR